MSGSDRDMSIDDARAVASDAMEAFLAFWSAIPMAPVWVLGEWHRVEVGLMGFRVDRHYIVRIRWSGSEPAEVDTIWDPVSGGRTANGEAISGFVTS